MDYRISILFLLLFIPLVLASEDAKYLSYEVDEVADLTIRVRNVSYIITDADCKVDIYSPDDNLYIDKANMSYFNRKYNYTYIFNETGQWEVEYFCNDTELNRLYILGRPVSIQPPVDISINVSNLNVSVTVNSTEIANDIWNDDNRTLTNISNVVGDVWTQNQTINPGLIGQFVYNIWNYVARYTHGIIV